VLQLHYFPGNASLAPHMLLEELGVPFELRLVDRAQDAQKSPAYLKLNPNGTIPVLVDGDLVLYETAAICLHLVDTHPGAGLAPAPLDPYALMLGRWTRAFARPARSLPRLGPYLARVLARPAVARTFEREGLAAPRV
jgi:glutathione S-transferase